MIYTQCNLSSPHFRVILTKILNHFELLKTPYYKHCSNPIYNQLIILHIFNENYNKNITNSFSIQYVTHSHNIFTKFLLIWRWIHGGIPTEVVYNFWNENSDVQNAYTTMYYELYRKRICDVFVENFR